MPQELEDLVLPKAIPPAEMLGIMHLLWTGVAGAAPADSLVRMLTATWAFETGWGAAMHCFNTGNLKGRDGDGHDWVFYTCSEIINGKEEFFNPPHPQCRFRAYLNLSAGVTDFIKLMRGRYAEAVTAAEANDLDGYLTKQKAKGYFTTELAEYKRRLSGVWTAVATVKYTPATAADLAKYPETKPVKRPEFQQLTWRRRHCYTLHLHRLGVRAHDLPEYDYAPGPDGDAGAVAPPQGAPLGGWYYEVKGPHATRLGRLDDKGEAFAERLPPGDYQVRVFREKPGQIDEEPPFLPPIVLDDAGVSARASRRREPAHGPAGVLGRLGDGPPATPDDSAGSAAWDVTSVRAGETAHAVVRCPKLADGDVVVITVLHAGATIGTLEATAGGGAASAPWRDWFHPARARPGGVLSRPSTFGFHADVAGKRLEAPPLVFHAAIERRVTYRYDGGAALAPKDKGYQLHTPFGIRSGSTTRRSESDGWIIETELPPGGATLILGRSTLIALGPDGRWAGAPRTAPWGQLTCQRFFDVVPRAGGLVLSYRMLCPAAPAVTPVAEVRRLVPADVPRASDERAEALGRSFIVVDRQTLTPTSAGNELRLYSFEYPFTGGDGAIELVVRAGELSLSETIPTGAP